MSEAAPADSGADALTRLEEQVSALQGEVRRLGAPPPSRPRADDLPPPTGGLCVARCARRPRRRQPRLPRFLLEGLFLGAVAAAAAIAELDAVAIAGVMIGAWVLVALIEWAASRAEGRHEIVSYAPAPAAPPVPDPAWYSPPVEQTLLDARATDSETAVTRLPPALDDVESTAERSA